MEAYAPARQKVKGALKGRAKIGQIAPRKCSLCVGHGVERLEKACGCMAAWFQVNCPHCDAALQVRLAVGNTTVACAECDQHFVAQLQPAHLPAEAASAKRLRRKDPVPANRSRRPFLTRHTILEYMYSDLVLGILSSARSLSSRRQQWTHDARVYAYTRTRVSGQGTRQVDTK